MKTAEEARDAALKRVLDNAGKDWQTAAFQVLLAQRRGSTMTGEEFRLKCLRKDIRPHHHNAWGGLWAGMIKAGLLADTGDEKNMQSPRSHARRTAIYKVR